MLIKTIYEDLDRTYVREVSHQYKNNDYLAGNGAVFPIINSSRKGKIYKYSKADWFRDEAGRRGPGAEAPRGGWATSSTNINPTNWAFATEVTDEDVENAMAQGAPPTDPMLDANEYSVDKIQLKTEILVANEILSGSDGSGTWVEAAEDAAGLWADTTTSNTLITDVITSKNTIWSNTGIVPNRLAMDQITFEKQKENPNLLDRYKHTQGPEDANIRQILAAVLGLDAIVVFKTIKNTATQDTSDTFTGAQVFEANSGKGSAFLYYYNPRPTLKSLNAGVVARVQEQAGGFIKLSDWYEDSKHQSVFEAASELDVVGTGYDLGKLFTDTHTT